MAAGEGGKLALLWRGDGDARNAATTDNNRLSLLFEGLAAVGVYAEAEDYADDMVDEVRTQLHPLIFPRTDCQALLSAAVTMGPETGGNEYRLHWRGPPVRRRGQESRIAVSHSRQGSSPASAGLFAARHSAR
jgi:hypothetical protein